MALSDDALTLLRGSIRSVWALELILLLRRHSDRDWSNADLVRELRGSEVVVQEALAGFRGAGLLVAQADGSHRYQPAAPMLDQWVEEIEQAYAIRPSAIIREIFAAPGNKVQIFADSFRFRLND
ncbi:hypothetical protein VY88_16560 [Azospirillum thiophilum]|uniref:Uncharacterized protein n=1 Tax=Azospirillum thiophilum TaxID=528244 RepID=A0AAC8W104_9PROT|nr:hypothetical protein [Azospirillum thiophilum]ALG73159.1 hypothetical protein AL072_16950 [Azospirillum thiophilum]KJR64666.1 hypothetical protein VY88_16560 [Azospirillum thiophilum]